MDVSCPSCSARYVTNDEKLRGKTARMRCKACNTAWLVTGPAAIDADRGPASKKTAAVVKTGSDREQRDLFAARDLDHGSVKDRSAPTPKYGFTGIGARDENSLLFRVDQLTSAARIKTPAPEQVANARASSSDDGVIDLKALSSAPQQARQVAPLFSEAPPPMAVDVNAPGLPVPFLASKVGPLGPRAVRALQAAGAAALLLVTGFGLSVMFKTEEPTRAVASMPAPVETVAPPEITPPPAPVAAAPVEEAPTETKAEPKGKRGKGKGGRGRGAKSVATASKPATGPKAMPKPADPCGCKGNFNCILACTAKGRR